MSNLRKVRAVTWAGMSFIPVNVLVVLTSGLTGSGFHIAIRWGSPPDQVANWMSDNATQNIIQCFVANLSYLVLMWVVVELCQALRSSGRVNPVPLQLMTLSTAAMVALLTLSNLVHGFGSIGGTAGHRLNEQFVNFCHEIGVLIAFGSLPLAGLLLIAAGIAIRQARTFPRWLVWPAFVIGAACVLDTFSVLAAEGSFAPHSLASITPYFLLFGWITAASPWIKPATTTTADNRQPHHAQEQTTPV